MWYIRLSLKMAFYIKLPNGKVSLSQLEIYAEKRLELLLKIYRCNGKCIVIKDIVEDLETASNSDCFIEGSKKDQISHFILRLGCSHDSEMSEVFIQSEVSLFMYRISCFSEGELLAMLKPIKRLHYLIAQEYQINNCFYGSEEMYNVLEIIEHLTKSMTWEQLVEAYCQGNNNIVMILPFQHVLDLVAKRIIYLRGGLAYVPCSKLAEVLKVIFELILRHGMKLARQKIADVMDDRRMKILMNRLKHQFYQSRPSSNMDRTELVRCEDVDSLQKFFPPCMSHLHSSLRENHRLRHFSRIQYTLFLKELGLPLNEAIHFWRLEYSQKPEIKLRNGQSNCSHTWDKDHRRYIYNIRHLYGMEGARRNYRGHCCTSLQEFSGSSGEEGGCPFSHFDHLHLQAMLTEEGISENVKSDITQSVQQESYTEACQTYMSNKYCYSSSIPKSSAYCCRNMQSSFPGNKVSTNNNYIQLKPEIEQFTDSLTQSKDTTFKKTSPTFSHNCKNKSIQFDSEITQNVDIEITKEEYCLSQIFQMKEMADEMGNKPPESQSCYNHETCPPSQINSSKQDIIKKEHIEFSRSSSLPLTFIAKPLDYYKTYKNLLEGLK